MTVQSTTATALFTFSFFNDPATTEIYTLSLHDALPISTMNARKTSSLPLGTNFDSLALLVPGAAGCQSSRSEEHTSELQSHVNLVCRLLLEKKKKLQKHTIYYQPNRNITHDLVSVVELS